MKREVKIGLTLLSAILVVYITITWVNNSHFFAAHKAEYTIRFDDVSGLKEGDPVMVFGYPSGSVRSIRIDNNGAIVTIGLNEEIILKSDASAEIQIKELMGGKKIELNPGQIGGPYDKSQPIKGHTTLDFSTAFSRVSEFMDKFQDVNIDSLIEDMTQIASAVKDVASGLDSLNTTKLVKDIESSASSASNILGDIEKRQIIKKLDNAFAGADSLIDKAGKTMDDVSVLTDHMTASTMPLADSMLTKLNQMMTDAEGMIVNLEEILKQMQDQNTMVGKMLYDPKTGADFEKTLDNLNKTLDHIRTKKVHVVMSMSAKQKIYDEEEGNK